MKGTGKSVYLLYVKENYLGKTSISVFYPRPIQILHIWYIVSYYPKGPTKIIIVIKIIILAHNFNLVKSILELYLLALTQSILSALLAEQCVCTTC